MIEFRFRTMKAWPRKQTSSWDRKRSPFKATLGRTYEELRSELTAVGAKGVVWIEAGFELRHIRNDGLPYSNAPKPSHPGVIVYAPETSKGPLRFVCDDCREWEHNLRAIVLTMERLRLADIYGVTKDAEQYRGFSALPPPADDSPAALRTVDDAADWCARQYGDLYRPLDLLRDAASWASVYRALAMKYHPDRNGGSTPPEWTQLQAAAALLDSYHASRR